jgi:L,D-transpeptidase YcbB
MKVPSRLRLLMLCVLLAVTGIAVARRPSPPRFARLRQQSGVPSLTQVSSPAAIAALRNIADAARNPELRWPDFGPYKAEVSKFYDSNGYALSWLREGRVTPQGLAVIGLLKNADAKGLDPEDYDGSRWDARLAALQQDPPEQDLVLFDTALTVSAMRYIRGVHAGRVNPKKFHFEMDVEEGPVSLADFLQKKVVRGNDPAGEIQKAEPPFLGYKKTLALLPEYAGYAKKDDGEKLQTTAKPVLPGQPYPSLARLGRYLQLIGDIPANVQLDPKATIYEGALVDGVKHYQDRHGESPTGKLDERTIDEMNVPIATRVQQIKLTLERWRWLPHSFAQPPVVVNIPEYRVRAFNADGTVALYRDVIVGKAYGHKSPTLESEIRNVVFRPYWNVPYSIQRGETVRKIEEDASYLAKHNFQVITPDGTLVTETAVTSEVLEGLKLGQLKIRQKPGATNSLGLVKFIFPNPYDVYLHGTDVPQLFSQDTRDLSHGCIRVEDPVELVAWVLRNNPGWDLERVKAVMNGDKDNVEVTLVKPIPIVIVYGTAIVNEENQIRFLDDVYGYDAELEKALVAGPEAW